MSQSRNSATSLLLQGHPVSYNRTEGAPAIPTSDDQEKMYILNEDIQRIRQIIAYRRNLIGCILLIVTTGAMVAGSVLFRIYGGLSKIASLMQSAEVAHCKTVCDPASIDAMIYKADWNVPEAVNQCNTMTYQGGECANAVKPVCDSLSGLPSWSLIGMVGCAILAVSLACCLCCVIQAHLANRRNRENAILNTELEAIKSRHSEFTDQIEGSLSASSLLPRLRQEERRYLSKFGLYQLPIRPTQGPNLASGAVALLQIGLS